MSLKIRNLSLAGQEVVISELEGVQFDVDGITDIESVELYESLLTLKGFEQVEEADLQAIADKKATEEAEAEALRKEQEDAELALRREQEENLRKAQEAAEQAETTNKNKKTK